MKKPKSPTRVLDLSAAVEPIETSPKPKPKPRQIDIDKAERAAAALRRWQTRAKMAQTKITKYRRKVRYYERKIGGTI